MPRWGEVIGSKGRARFKPRTYPKKDGTEGTTNDVDKFYDYDPAFFTEGQSWVAEAASAPEVSTPKWQAGKF